MALQAARAIVGDTANAAGLANFAIHYAPPAVDYVFSRNKAEALLEQAEKSLKETEEFFRGEYLAKVFSDGDMTEFHKSMSDWRFRLELEKTALRGDKNQLIQVLGVEAGLQFESGDQTARLTLKVQQLARFHIRALSQSQKKREKAKRAFEDEDDLPNLQDHGYLQYMKSWVQSKITFTSTSPARDVETGTPDLFMSPRESSGLGIENLDEMTLEATHGLPVSPEESSSGLCRMGIVIWYQGARFILGDPKLRTLQDARRLMSPLGLSAIAHTAFEVVSKGAVPPGLHRITRGSLLITPSTPVIVDDGCD